MVFDGEVPRQQPDCREIKAATCEALQNQWESSGRARGFDAAEGSMLGQPEHPRAVGKERRAALREIQSARVYLDEQHDEVSRRVTLIRHRALDVPQQLVVGKAGDHGMGACHTPV